jgi:hypothetical protein
MTGRQENIAHIRVAIKLCLMKHVDDWPDFSNTHINDWVCLAVTWSEIFWIQTPTWTIAEVTQTNFNAVADIKIYLRNKPIKENDCP